MGLTIAVMDKQENFIEFLDEELCTLTETIEAGGLRTLSLTYKFQDLLEDKELFRIGNKVWVQGDVNLSDCLYVINTEVTEDIYKENHFKLDLEEVLVELNYAPLFSQTELTTAKDSSNNSIFHTVTTNGKQEVVIDWNALNYWFGSYFNIGIVQQCISEYASRISITGTVNRMNLLRDIEEETGNVFVTRYEKDILNNTIHRYLDFLNPINCQKNWSLNLEYDFHDNTNIGVCYDKNGNIVPEEEPWTVKRFTNDHIPPESRTETDDPPADEFDYDVEVDEPIDYESNQVYDDEPSPYFPPVTNINPANCDFRITTFDGHLLDADGRPYNSESTAEPLTWDCEDAGLDGDDYPKYLISLQKVGNEIDITCNEKSYCVVGIGEVAKAYLPEIKELDYGEYIACDNEIEFTNIPDDSYFAIYDHVNEVTLFRTRLNTEIGHVHEEVLDFGFNLENIEHTIDETDTYTAVSPVLKLSEGTGDSKSLTRSDMTTIINRWLNLSITKGTVVPMIVEKVNVAAASLSAAQTSLGTFNRSYNYWIRPLKPNDNTDGDGSNKQYEFYRAIAYWKAPYTKVAGQMHVETDKILNTEYDNIYTRPDTRNDKAGVDSPKMGNTESTDEDIYAIYNQVCLYLKEHETPSIDLKLDVANLRGHEYNNYDLHDKIYIKLPSTNELVTARITKTSKEAHDIAKNTVSISNYKNINTIKTLTHHTHIDSGNAEFTYPASKTLTARLVNDEPTEDTMTYPAMRLLTFALYKVENGARTFTGTVYTKLTNATGYASINMKYDPGNYEIDISWVGDEEYEESSMTVQVSVGGTKEVATKKTNTTKKKKKSKTTKKKKKTKKKTKWKTVKQYWSKCGRSPDKKTLISIAQPSSADADRYTYNQLWKTVFKNYCPECGNTGTLRFDGGSANKCITSEGAYGRGYKVGVPEHEVTCIHCDSDFCGVTGQEKSYGHSSRLRTVKDPERSSQGEFDKLVNGKLLYGTKKVKIKTKKKTNKVQRKIRASGISDTIKKKALSIVGNKTGKWAMWAIVDFMDNNIWYRGYENFQDSAEDCLRRGSANCCDGTRLYFELCDAAGLTEYYNFYYCHVYGHVYGIVETKSSGNWRYVDCASDYHGCWAYVCQGYAHGGRSSTYPELPF